MFVITGPSGVGKGTLIGRLRERVPELEMSVSATTRRPRPGERDGVDYHFVDRAAFQEMITRREFLEYAEVHGHHYGTARTEVEGRLASGCFVFLDIDVQGARQVRASIPDAVKIFVFPPSYAELHRRLVARRQDDEATIALRMKNALKEMREYGDFDYVIINDRLEEAARLLASIVSVARLRPLRMRAAVEGIVEDFERALREE